MNSPENMIAMALTTLSLGGLLILRLRGAGQAQQEVSASSGSTIWDAIDADMAGSSSNSMVSEERRGGQKAVSLDSGDSASVVPGLFGGFSAGWNTSAAEALDSVEEMELWETLSGDQGLKTSFLPHSAKEYLVSRLKSCVTFQGAELLLSLCLDENNIIAGKARKNFARIETGFRDRVLLERAGKENPNGQERIAVMEVMGHVDDLAFIPVLSANVDEGGVIAAAAAAVLGRSEHSAAAAPLQRFLKQLDGELQSHFNHLVPLGNENRAAAMPGMDQDLEIGSPEEILAEVISGTPTGSLGKAHVVPLIRALGDTDLPHQIRYHAATALGRIGAPLANDCLVKALDDTADTVRYGSIQALADLGNRKAAPLIAAKLRDANEFVRSAAAHALGRLQAVESMAEIMEGMKDSSGSVRYSCLMAALELDPDSAVSMVRMGLSDIDEQVRIEAVKAVARLRDADSLGHIIRILGQSDGELRTACAETLFELEDPRAIDSLIDMLRNLDHELLKMAGEMVRSELEEVRRNVTVGEAMARGDEQQLFISTMTAGDGRENDVSGLWKALESDSIFVVGSAMLSLAEKGDFSRVLKSLEKRTVNSSIYIRETSARGFSLLVTRPEMAGQPASVSDRMIKCLKKLAGDREESVRFTAARSLGKFKKFEQASKLLKKLSKDRSVEVANAARQAMETNEEDRAGRRFLLRGPQPELPM